MRKCVIYTMCLLEKMETELLFPSVIISIRRVCKILDKLKFYIIVLANYNLEGRYNHSEYETIIRISVE